MKKDDSIIKGTIVGRRSMGRKCAFADVSTSGDDNEAEPIKLIFRHQSFLLSNNSITIDDDGISLDEPFPNKDASLPYGAKVIIQLGVCQKVASKTEDGRIDDVYEVLQWKVIEHPRELAEQLASLHITEESKTVGQGAMSCSTYFKARGEAFDSVKQHRMHTIDKKKNRSSSIDDQTSEIPNNNTTDIDYSDIHHGGKQAKAKRAKVFASWVLDTFFDIPMGYTDPPLLTDSDDTNKKMICQPCSIESTNDNKKSCLLHNANVYDIAGGKGQLSVELLVQQMYHLGLNSNNEKKEDNDGKDTSLIRECTIIDPLVRRGDTKHRQSKLKKAQSHVNWLQQNRQRKSSHHDSSLGGSSNSTSDANTKSQDIKHLAMEFNATSFEQYIQPTSSPKLLLGLHPDQCTEDILDVALEHNISVAIVPCCGKF